MNYGCGPRCRCEGIHSYRKKGVREEVTYMKKTNNNECNLTLPDLSYLCMACCCCEYEPPMVVCAFSLSQKKAAKSAWWSTPLKTKKVTYIHNPQTDMNIWKRQLVQTLKPASKPKISKIFATKIKIQLKWVSFAHPWFAHAKFQLPVSLKPLRLV